ncbi:MAG: STAS domain-containing protein [Nocardiopsaceae bacterium]|jgi:anti-anti-sigma factor|nr:STAS domain-containing protein [Nocardiopsaceae bacterium]
MDPARYAATAFRCDLLEPDGEILITVAGEVDLDTAPSLGECLARASVRGKPVFLDLTCVSFIDGRGFRVINAAAESAAGAGLYLTVATRSALVGRILSATAASGAQVLVG